MPIKVGKVELYMGPQGAGAPDDLRDVIVKFIDGAKRRLDIAVQELEDEVIAEAIIRARQRKARVWIVMEADYLRAKRAHSKPWTPGGQHEPNRKVHNAILRANIQIRTDFNSNIFHQKFIIRDGTSLLSGSTNFTPTGVEKNLNHIVIIHDAKIAKAYGREFAEIRRGHFGKQNEGHDPAPPEIKVSNLPIKVAFSPDHNPEMEIMKQMAKAKQRIDFAMFTFAQSSGIDDEMISKHRSGVAVRGALDSRQANQKWAAARPIKNAGAALWKVPSSKTVGKLHHKLMVLDERVVIAGSFNYTGPATRLNDENILVIGSFDQKATAHSIGAQQKIAKFALDEIDRIIAKHGKKMT